MLFGWFVNLSVQTFQPLIEYLNKEYLCVLLGIGDVHQFIGRYLIPLNP